MSGNKNKQTQEPKKKGEGLRADEISKDDPEEVFEMLDIIGEGWDLTMKSETKISFIFLWNN